jgi:xanthine dehydrogenase accessory factor
MTCGGVSEGFVRIVKPNEKLVIFGAGHVSQKIASIASSLSFDVYIVDDREEYKNIETFKDVKKFLCCTPSEALNEINLNNRSYVILVTRGHVTDYEALKEVINRDVAYIGMMGSKKKVKEIKEKLNNENIDKEKIKKLYAPIGLDICNGTPEEIAISIISEILVIKNKGTLKHLSEREE